MPPKKQLNMTRNAALAAAAALARPAVVIHPHGAEGVYQGQSGQGSARPAGDVGGEAGVHGYVLADCLWVAHGDDLLAADAAGQRRETAPSLRLRGQGAALRGEHHVRAVWGLAERERRRSVAGEARYS